MKCTSLKITLTGSLLLIRIKVELRLCILACVQTSRLMYIPPKEIKLIGHFWNISFIYNEKKSALTESEFCTVMSSCFHWLKLVHLMSMLFQFRSENKKRKNFNLSYKLCKLTPSQEFCEVQYFVHCTIQDSHNVLAGFTALRGILLNGFSL